METRGFVRKLYKVPVEGQRAQLVADGVKIIYEVGTGAEDLDNCLMAFRKRGGIIKIAADLRVFGDTQDEITEAVSKCEEAKVQIIDLAHPDLKTVSKLQRYAFARLAFMRRWDGDKKRASRTGSVGGRAKGERQAVKREGLISKAAVQRLVAKVGKKLTWRDIEEVTEISTATLRRHYL